MGWVSDSAKNDSLVQKKRKRLESRIGMACIELQEKISKDIALMNEHAYWRNLIGYGSLKMKYGRAELSSHERFIKIELKSNSVFIQAYESGSVSYNHYAEKDHFLNLGIDIDENNNTVFTRYGMEISHDEASEAVLKPIIDFLKGSFNDSKKK